jgi:hypothetical protein
MIYIKYIKKEKILYELWRCARLSQYFRYCPDLAPSLNIQTCTIDIKSMNGIIDLTSYYGRLLFIDISGDWFDPFNYDIYNGDGTAKLIIDSIKKEELAKCVLRYNLIF